MKQDRHEGSARAPVGRRAKWISIIGLTALGVAAAAVVLAPRIVQDRMNPVTGQSGTVTSAAVTLHESLTVADLHSDALLWNRDLNDRNGYGHVDLPRLRDGNVALQGFTLVTRVPRSQNYEANDSTSDRITLAAVLQRWPLKTWGSPLERALHQARKLHRTAARSNGALTVLQTTADLEEFLGSPASRAGRVAGFLGIEGAHALEGDAANLAVLHEAGVRMVGLAHFHDNQVAGSAHGTEKGGLTPLGREVVARSEELGMVIDLAHASGRTIDDVLAVATRPVLVSHTGVRGTCPGRRNLSDEHVDGIAATGGVIGIGFWPEAVCGDDVADIVRALLFVSERVGPEHVALGSDFDGTVAVPFDASGMVWITQGLLEAGMAPDDVRRVMGANVVRVLRAILPAEENA